MGEQNHDNNPPKENPAIEAASRQMRNKYRDFLNQLVPRRIREAREAANLNRSRLARLSGVPRSTVIAIEKEPEEEGHQEATYVDLACIAKVCGVDLDFFRSDDLYSSEA